MMAYKAKKTGLVFYGKYSTSVEYEYRGKTYDVEYSNCWTYCVTPARIQHENAQREIDREIELESKPINGKPIDLDEIWHLYGWD